MLSIIIMQRFFLHPQQYPILDKKQMIADSITRKYFMQS